MQLSANINSEHVNRMLLVGFLMILFNLPNLSAQDFIYRQYGEPIYGKVLDIEKKELLYQKQTYFDSAQYAIKRRSVVKIIYSDSSEVILNKSRWSKTYRPAIYFTLGAHFSGLTGNADVESDAFGLGHKGVFDLSITNLGISYSVDFFYGNYYYYPDPSDSYDGNVPHDPIFSSFVYIGLEYRHIYRRGFAVCGGSQLGYNQLAIPDQGLRYGSKWPNISAYIGVQITFIEFGIRYTGSQQIRIGTPGETLIDRINKKEFLMTFIQGYWAVKF